MKFLFFVLAATFVVGAQDLNDSHQNLLVKLKYYQNVTGISDDTMMSIWQKSDATRSIRRLSRRRRASQDG